MVKSKGLAELARLLPLAAAGIMLGVTSMYVVQPHPVDPLDPPLPVVDLDPLARVAATDRLIWTRVRAAPLNAEVRAVGSAYRAWNTAASGLETPSSEDREGLISELRATLGVLRGRVGDERSAYAALADLRAYQTEAFLLELEHAAKSGDRSVELRALGGALVSVLVRNGWLEPNTLRAHVPQGILRARYKLHWDAVVFGLGDCDTTPIAVCMGQTTLPLDAGELRALLSFLIAHPVVRQADVEDSGSWAAAADRRRLVYLDRMITLDRTMDPSGGNRPLLGDYPFLLGRGALLFRLRQFEPAADLFRAHLTRSPTDAIARNWYLAAVRRARGD